MNTNIALVRILRRGCVLVGALALIVWPARAQVLGPNPDAVGLWVGEVTVNQVTHAAGGTNAPVADPASLRILLHVGTNGTVRLLKDITIGRRRGRTPDTLPATDSQLLLVSDPALLPGLAGLVRRNGRLVGQRLAAAGFDFPGTELPLDGGLGAGFRCAGSLVLDGGHPTNPFRHAYHPALANGVRVTRSLELRFTQAATVVNGVTRLTGEYQETVTGLHRVPLVAQGGVVLNRVSSIGILNR